MHQFYYLELIWAKAPLVSIRTFDSKIINALLFLFLPYSWLCACRSQAKVRKTPEDEKLLCSLLLTLQGQENCSVRAKGDNVIRTQLSHWMLSSKEAAFGKFYLINTLITFCEYKSVITILSVIYSGLLHELHHACFPLNNFISILYYKIWRDFTRLSPISKFYNKL